MKWITDIFCGGLVVLGLAPQTGAVTPGEGNPYQAVVERNVFDLKPVIPPPTEDVIQKTPPAKIELQGITEGILGKRQALLKILEPAKPGEQPKPRALIMDEGERRGIVTVLEINPLERSVKFDNGGVEETIVLTNAPTRVAVAGPGGAPGPIPVPAVSQPGAAGVPAPPLQRPAYVVPKSGASLPTRPLRVATSGAGSGTTPGVLGIAGAPVVAGVSPVGGAQNAALPNPAQLSHEEQAIMIEVERERTKDATAQGDLPPLPPTELTPPGSPGLPPTQEPAGK